MLRHDLEGLHRRWRQHQLQTWLVISVKLSAPNLIRYWLSFYQQAVLITCNVLGVVKTTCRPKIRGFSSHKRWFDLWEGEGREQQPEQYGLSQSGLIPGPRLHNNSQMTQASMVTSPTGGTWNSFSGSACQEKFGGSAGALCLRFALPAGGLCHGLVSSRGSGASPAGAYFSPIETPAHISSPLSEDPTATPLWPRAASSLGPLLAPHKHRPQKISKNSESQFFRPCLVLPGWATELWGGP